MIPLAITTISVLRLPPDSGYEEPYPGPPTYDVVASGVRAVIDRPPTSSAGLTQMEGGEQAVIRYGLKCDPTDLGYLDKVRDEKSGNEFHIQWLIVYPGHIEAGLYRTEGEV